MRHALWVVWLPFFSAVRSFGAGNGALLTDALAQNVKELSTMLTGSPPGTDRESWRYAGSRLRDRTAIAVID